MEPKSDFVGYLIGEDSIEFFGLGANTIFAEEPEWFVDAVDNGDIFLDDSDEKMKVKVNDEYVVVEPGEYITRRLFTSGFSQLVVEK